MMMIIQSLLVVLVFLASSANGQGMNPCHDTNTIKRTPADCTTVTLPAGFCSACRFGGYNSRGNYDDCKHTFQMDFSDTTCMGAYQDYVDLNSCDTARKTSLNEFMISSGTNETARQLLDYYYYALCENGCDCIPQEHGDKNNPAFDVHRGNCQAHAWFDICQVQPNIELIKLAGTPDVSGLPKACPLLRTWIRTPDGQRFRSAACVSVDPDVKYFLERLIEAEQLTTNPDYFQGCLALELAQGRVDEMTPDDIFVEGPTASTSGVFLVKAPTNEVLQPALFDFVVIDLDDVGRDLNIKFEPSVPGVVRVNFIVNDEFFRSEGRAPYAMAGDSPPGNYFAWKPVSDNTYRIQIDGLDANRQVVESKVICISFCTGCSETCSGGCTDNAPLPTLSPIVLASETPSLPVTTEECAGVCTNRLDSGSPPPDGTSNFRLVDAAANTEFSPNLFDNVVIDKAEFGDSLNMIYLPTVPVGSVKFIEQGNPAGVFLQTESVAPYALRGDIRSNYREWAPPVGTYEIFADAFENRGGTGSLVESAQINVVICDGCYATCC